MADIAKTVSGLEEFKRNLNDVGDFYEETLVGDAIELLKSQQAEIERLKGMNGELVKLNGMDI